MRKCPLMTHYMHRLTIVLAIVGLSVTSAIVAQPAPPDPLRLEGKMPLGNVRGRIDHMAVDLAHHRLFVAELGNGSVGVIDLDAQKVLQRLSNLKEPQGVAYVQSNDSLYVANGGDGSVRVFRGTEYAPAGQIDLGADADNLRVDLPGNRLLVGYGSGAIGIIDLRGNNKTESFPLNAHPESFQLDAETRQIFVNLPNKRGIAIIDAGTGHQRASWSVRYGGNFPMTLDHERQRVLGRLKVFTPHSNPNCSRCSDRTFCPRHGSLVFGRTRSTKRTGFHLDLPRSALNNRCNHAYEVGGAMCWTIFIHAYSSSRSRLCISTV
jgi:hypothetical protein